jgi:hypothetical protein
MTGQKDEQEGLAVQPAPNSNRVEPNELDAQFPYLFIGEYLERRGLNHLACYIPWRGQKVETHRRRTKMFINILKIRLKFLIPERCKDIVRNEAHVRLATSVWYASRFLLAASAISLVLLGLALLVPGTPRPSADFLHVLLLDIGVFALPMYLKQKIEQFLHYMRVREIVYVLETAHFATECGLNLELDGLGKAAGDATAPAAAQ